MLIGCINLSILILFALRIRNQQRVAELAA
jgi:hypothetical protein